MNDKKKKNQESTNKAAEKLAAAERPGHAARGRARVTKPATTKSAAKKEPAAVTKARERARKASQP